MNRKTSSNREDRNGLPRRDFLATAGAGVLGALAAGWAPGAAAAQTGEVGSLQATWLDRLGGSHGQFFDMAGISGGKALQQSRNFLNAYRDAFGVESDDIDLVIGMHGSAAVLAFDDSAWGEFDLGEHVKVKDPATAAGAERNVFAGGNGDPVVPADATIGALQRRGVIFLLCNNAFNRLVGELARKGHGSTEDVRQRLLDHLLPGVEVVPALVVAVNQAHEKGLSYVWAG